MSDKIFIHLPRQLGKTTKIIDLAERQNAYIVCLNQKRVENLWNLSIKNNKKIRFPLTLDEYISYKGCKTKFLIDDLDDAIKYMLIRNIKESGGKIVISKKDKINYYFNELLSLRNLEYDEEKQLDYTRLYVRCITLNYNYYLQLEKYLIKCFNENKFSNTVDVIEKFFNSIIII